jgi:hypothetical protein
MKPSIAEIIRRIRPLPPVHKAAHLRGLIASEPRRSIRRVELEAALKDVINRQLGREIRQDRRAS